MSHSHTAWAPPALFVAAPWKGLLAALLGKDPVISEGFSCSRVSLFVR